MWLSRFSATMVILQMFLFPMFPAISRDYNIYAINQSVPMGDANEVIKKNFYLDIGKNQGVGPGTKLEVYRTLSRYNALDSNKQFQYKIKVGVLLVIHAEEGSAIAEAKEFYNKTSLQIDNPDFMIGDRVQVALD